MLKALIIEPSKTYQHVLAVNFRELGYEALIVSSGEAAFEVIAHESPALICLSLHLSDMNGIRFCERLRDRVQKQIPVVMITSVDDTGVYHVGLKAGLTEVFSKSDLSGLNRFLKAFSEQARVERGMIGRVLYIEDSTTAAFATQRHLEKLGLSVDHFKYAEPAIEAFHQNEYDLVLTDVLLKNSMSGLTLARTLREVKGHKQRVPILAMSGIEDVARKIELLRSGVNDYISKPVIEEELAARVRNLIANKKLMDKVEQQQRTLKKMAMTDQLTSLRNRHSLADIVPRRMSEARRHGFPLSLIMADIDFFKKINDTHGHAIGDMVLVELAGLLKKSCREEDLAVRYGGEEFVLLLPHCSGKNAVNRAEDLRVQIESLRPGNIPISASFGVTELPTDRLVSFDQLFDAVDAAVYEAKDLGRNQVVFGMVAGGKGPIESKG